MKTKRIVQCVLTCLLAFGPAASSCGAPPSPLDEKLKGIRQVIVIYAENRSFDNIFGMLSFDNDQVEGIRQALGDPGHYTQVDRNGKELEQLPPVWLEPNSDTPLPDPRFKPLANKPFRIDDVNQLDGPDMMLGERTRDLVHMFYQNKEQIDDGRLDRYAEVSDAGGLVMAYYDGRELELARLAEQYTLADHFFMGAYGGSFLNHMWLVCACTPQYREQTRGGVTYPALDPVADARAEPDKRMIIELDANKQYLKRRPIGDGERLSGPAAFETPKGSFVLLPDEHNAGKMAYFAVNTVQPPYQPSYVKPGTGHPDYASPKEGTPLPPLTDPTIADRLDDKKIDWGWYAEGWNEAHDNREAMYYVKNSAYPDFHPHHQPFNYFARFDPGTPKGKQERADHLKDADQFLNDLDAHADKDFVAFYKPQGIYNQHPGYADVATGDHHIAKLVRAIMKTAAWKSTLIVITYDENGGFWDHVPPPPGDDWGPGTRIPAIIISPFSKCGAVDKTQYDTTSILKFMVRRFGLETLPGLAKRTNAGDLTGALDLSGAHPDGCPAG